MTLHEVALEAHSPHTSAPVSLLDFSKEELTDFVLGLGEPKYRANQLWDWIYKRYARNFEQMQNLPKSLYAESPV